jgi:hypothetical protein
VKASQHGAALVSQPATYAQAHRIIMAFWKEQNEAFPTVLPAGQTDKWKALKPRVEAVNVPKWAQGSQESIWESGWEVRDGAGKRVMECEMCTENDKDGRSWERQWQ